MGQSKPTDYGLWIKTYGLASIDQHLLTRCQQLSIASLKKTVLPNCILYIRKYFSFFAVSKSEDKKCQVIQNGPLSKDTKLSLIKSAG
jgi:hypothetical protein